MTSEEDYDDDDDDVVDALGEIRQRFAATLPAWRDEARSLRSKEDGAALKSHCHRIKGTAGMLGCTALSAASAKCESILTNDLLDAAIDEALEAVFHCIDSVVAEHVTNET